MNGFEAFEQAQRKTQEGRQLMNEGSYELRQARQQIVRELVDERPFTTAGIDIDAAVAALSVPPPGNRSSHWDGVLAPACEGWVFRLEQRDMTYKLISLEPAGLGDLDQLQRLGRESMPVCQVKIEGSWPHSSEGIEPALAQLIDLVASGHRHEPTSHEILMTEQLRTLAPPLT